MCPDAPPPPTAPDAETRDAILWISGLDDVGGPAEVSTIARRIAVALDNEDQATAATYSVDTPSSSDALPVCTIVRAENGDSRRVIDVFGVSVKDQLVGPVERMGRFRQALYAAPVVLAATLVLLRRIRQGVGKSPRERWQLLYAIGCVVMMFAALIAIVGFAIAGLTTDDVAGVPGWVGSAVLAVGGLGLWKTSTAKKLRELGLTLYAVYRYIERADDTGATLRGDLSRVLNLVGGTPDKVRYGRVIAVAYSFGSLVALDACFSPTTEPTERLKAIDLLITIGCPYDAVRALRPDYAGARYWREDIPGRWVNVFAPSDVLSSNFRDDDASEQPTVPIQLRDHPDGGRAPRNVIYRIDGRDGPVGFDESLLLRGLAFHGRYWDGNDENAESVFAPIVRGAFVVSPV